MPKGIYPRKKRYRAKVARQAVAIEHMSTVSRKGKSIDMVEDVAHQVAEAHRLVEAGRQLIREGWDLINSIPKRI